MRIAMMTNNYKPVIGGVPISIERLAQGLRRLGHTVYIFAPDCGDNGPDDPFVIRCHTFEKRLTGGFPVVNMLALGIEERFRSLCFDIIHVHHPMIMGQVALYFREKYQIPVVFTYHTRYEMYLHYFKPYVQLQKYAQNNDVPGRAVEEMLRCIKERMVLGFVRHFISQCDLVFAPTATMAEYLEEQNISVPIQVMPTGLPEEAYCQDPTAADTLREWFLEGKQYLLCTVSRLSQEKNLPFLLRGLSVLKQQMGDVFRMMMIGDGPQRQELEKLALQLGLAQAVTFLGFLPNDQIGLYHRASDAFLFASCSETQGIVLLEAMAAHSPVVALDAVGVRDVVIHGQNGFMTAPDEFRWAGRVRQILENETLRHRMSQVAFQTACGYRSDHIACIAEQSYRQVLRGRQIAALELGIPCGSAG